MTHWDSLWTGGRILSMSDPENPSKIIENGALAVRNGVIVWRGSADHLNKVKISPKTTIHNLDGKLITPGLIDCHTHLVFGGNRAEEFEQRLMGASYEDISRSGGGIKSTVAATQKESEQALYISALRRAQQLIKSGVTTLEIKSGYGLDLETELKMLRVVKKLAANLPVTIRRTYLAAHVLPDAFKENRQSYIDYIIHQILPEVVRHDLADTVDGFCEGIAFNSEEIDQLFAAAKKSGLDVRLHAEQLSNCGGALIAAKHNALSADHLEYADDETVARMAEAGMVAVLLPGAYYYLNETQKPPINKFGTYNVPIAISTDCNPGSSPLLSLTAAMNMACVLYKMAPIEVLKGVTINAAQALGIKNTKGSLCPMKDADFVIWDLQHPSEICYWGGTSMADKVIHKGQIIASM